MVTEKPKLRFFFDWGVTDTCLWPSNQNAYDLLDYPADIEELDLSEKTKEQIRTVATEFQTALNWEDTAAVSILWKEKQCIQFNQTAVELFRQIQEEIGEKFEVINTQEPMQEDPELEAYLADPDKWWEERNRNS